MSAIDDVALASDERTALGGGADQGRAPRGRGPREGKDGPNRLALLVTQDSTAARKAAPASSGEILDHQSPRAGVADGRDEQLRDRELETIRFV